MFPLGTNFITSDLADPLPLEARGISSVNGEAAATIISFKTGKLNIGICPMPD
jgi:hypothetical protein